MSAALASAVETAAGTPSSTAQPEIEAAIRRACHRIAPLWPLKHFVAVNPFLGFSDHSFGAACATLRRVAGADMLMPRAFYRASVAAGTIEDEDLVAALADVASSGKPHSIGLEALKCALAAEPVGPRRPRAVVATVADILDGLSAGDRHASRTAFMVDEIAKWCAAYFDEGQSAWRLPTRDLPPYAAWRASMRHDRNPETMGVRGFRAAVVAMPDDPTQAVGAVVRALGIPARALDDYLWRALFDIGGWAACARYRVWESALDGRADDTLAQLLAIRVVWGYALFLERTDKVFRDAWAAAMQAAAALPSDGRFGDDPDLEIYLILQDAYEAAFRRRLIGRLRQHAATDRPRAASGRPAVQAAFCIDVRSEVYRRALETICPGVETIGFAGFFGFPIEYVRIGLLKGGAQCPVLLKPTFVVCEAVEGASSTEEADILGLRLLRRRAVKAWKAFKLSAVSSFAYVETVGPLFAGKLIGDSAGLTRTVSDPDTDGLDRSVRGRVGPRLQAREVGGRATGFNVVQRLDIAEKVLRAMSLTAGFARLVMLTGHGSTTVNNPHASGLDCGACGGHTGEANARVAAAILNDPDVRGGLRSRDITVPPDTWFLGCLHDTTTDEVTVFDIGHVPQSHHVELGQLQVQLREAGALARRERAGSLGLAGAPGLDRRIARRSRDWSQVRPEWGLAGNAAFIAAPRERTRGLELSGRVFLHDYDWRKDATFGVLELIMTAPMVVASWINLQYYGSTVNNRVFGSGDKTLHNVVGQLGVLEGNAGDLKVGLPLQAVQGPAGLAHQPLRLSVFIEAPSTEIDRVIATHETVRHLVENGWVHLFALADQGRTIHRYSGTGQWRPA